LEAAAGRGLIGHADILAVRTRSPRPDAAIDQAANTSDGQTALELLRRLRNLQQQMHEAMPIVAAPLEPFEIVD
jgi:hypothetical protein